MCCGFLLDYTHNVHTYTKNAKLNCYFHFPKWLWRTTNNQNPRYRRLLIPDPLMKWKERQCEQTPSKAIYAACCHRLGSNVLPHHMWGTRPRFNHIVGWRFSTGKAVNHNIYLCLSFYAQVTRWRKAVFPTDKQGVLTTNATIEASRNHWSGQV